jgi:hypothetical protein
MDASKGIRSIIEDAKAKGLRVEEATTRCIISTGKTSRAVGLVIYEDGTAIRSDVRLDLCLTIRRHHEIRSILGLPAPRKAKKG